MKRFEVHVDSQVRMRARLGNTKESENVLEFIVKELAQYMTTNGHPRQRKL